MIFNLYRRFETWKYTHRLQYEFENSRFWIKQYILKKYYYFILIDEQLKTACGSPCYAAPEMIAGIKSIYTFKI